MRNSNKVTNKISYIKRSDLLILCIVFIMLLALVVGMYVGSKKNKEEQIILVHESMEILAENQRLQFQQFIDNKVEILGALAKYPQIYEMDKEQQSEFIRNHSQELGFHQIFVMDKAGKAFYIEENITRNQKKEDFYCYVMENDIYITEPFYGADATTMTISVSIRNEDGKKIGALCGAVELNEIRETFSQNTMFLNGSSYLINRDGYYVSSADMNQVYNKENIYEEPDTYTSVIKEAFYLNENKKGTIIKDGIEYQTNVIYLDSFDWVLVQCIETNEVLKDWNYITVWNYVSLIIVIIIIVCVIRIAVYWQHSNKKVNLDLLTGCCSRVAMQNMCEQIRSNLNSDVAVVYLDLNKFKYINDYFGHEKGDETLKLFAGVLKDVLGKKGYVGRIGGDEFMVILLDIQEKEVQQLCEEVNVRLKEMADKLELPYTVNTSFGIAMREKGNDKPIDEIIRLADERMYIYKKNHKDDV